MEIKILCWKYNIESVEFSRKGIVFGFYLNQPYNIDKIMKIGFSLKSQFSVRSDQKIFYDFMGHLNEDRFIIFLKSLELIN